MATYVPRRPYCLGTPSEYKRLMVKLNTPETFVAHHVNAPEALSALWFDTRGTGYELNPLAMNLQPGTTLYFAASKFAGYYYILQWSARLQRFGCSCKDSKTDGFCQHIEMAEEQTGALISHTA